jgi:hypothetical protein
VVRASRLGGWRVGRGVRDYHSGSLTISKGDGSSLSGVCAGAGAGAGVRSGLGRHASVHGLSDSDVRGSRRAVGRLSEVNSGRRWAGAFNRSHGGVLSGLVRVGLGDRADRCAWGRNSSDAVGDRRDVGGQHVSCG